MLVHRWVILRGLTHVNVPLRKVTALACCLHKFHNYCTNEIEIACYEQSKICPFFSSVNGSMPMEEDYNGNYVPNEILSGGNHSNDFVRRKVPINQMPRECMLQIIREKDFNAPNLENKCN